MASRKDLVERALDSNPFERVVATRQRPRFSIEPLSVAWNAVAFRVSGDRECVACVPRVELPDFLDKLDAGALDAPIERFLAQPPSGRVLRAVSQTGSTGLFDELSSPDAIVPSERLPGRAPLGMGGGGGRPTEARRNKNRKGRRGPSRAVLAAGAAVVAVVVVAAVALASSGGDGSQKVAVATTSVPVTTTTAPTTTTLSPSAVVANQLTGTWTVTRTVTASNNPRVAAGSTSEVAYTITSNCAATACAVHVVAPGVGGSVLEGDLAFVGDHYEGALTGTSPCTSDATGELLSTSPNNGTMSLSPTGPQQFIGVLETVLGASEGCAPNRVTSFDLAGQRA